jgi:pimeloyl-ACP methyl ester carboxylesterase
MAPLAKELAQKYGVLEPMQTKLSISELVQELKETLEENANLPVILIGHSWGAMFSFIFTSQYPAMIKKLILIGSAVFEEKYAKEIMNIRLSRLTSDEQVHMLELMESIDAHKDTLSRYLCKTDSFDPIHYSDEILELSPDTYERIWGEAKEMRSNGSLLELGKLIQVPVTVIHGDYDPYPVEGVVEPLSNVISNLHCHIIENCGHNPWYENQAKNNFFEILINEIEMG